MQITPITTKDVIYLIMPDRFSCSDSPLSSENVNREKESYWHGGNITGIIDRLEYVANLGVTALWLTPIMENHNPIEMKKYTSYHGYGITDYCKVDEHFGTIEDYQKLVEKAHRLGLKVVFDLVLNHCGIGSTLLKKHPSWFNRLDSKKTPRLTNYNTTTILGSYVSKYDKETTVKGWFTPRMPDFDLTNPEVLEYFSNTIDWWIDRCPIDAIRLDTYQYADKGAMLEWQRIVQKKHPGLSIIAETWVPNAAYTSEIQKQYNTSNNRVIVMDFAFQQAIEKAFSAPKGANQERALYDHFVYDFLYDDASHTLAFLDNHDLSRWCYSHKNVKQVKQAIGILLTIPRIPQILYGTEILLKGDGKGIGDGNWRCDFPGGWEEDDTNLFDEAKRKENKRIYGFWNFTQRLLLWRKNSEAITKGKMLQFLPQNGVYVYARYTESEKVAVFVNLSRFKQTIEMARYREIIPRSFLGRDILSGKTLSCEADNLIINKDEIIIAEKI